MRGLGPSLAAAGVAAALHHDPALEVYGATGLLAMNDDWREGDVAAIEALQLAPRFDRGAALLLRLRPGSYTVVVHGQNSGTGVALLEVYDCGNVEN